MVAGEGEVWVVAGPSGVIFRVDSETLPIA
jgi:hypothetical protein